LIQVVRDLDAVGVQTDGLALRRPSLDEVFLALTGHTAEDEPEAAEMAAARRTGRATESEGRGAGVPTAEK
jgi:ABC-2 type transport system ATP-binding protein